MNDKDGSGDIQTCRNKEVCYLCGMEVNRLRRHLLAVHGIKSILRSMLT